MAYVKLLRQLDGRKENEIVEYPDLDAAQLIEQGLVEPAQAPEDATDELSADLPDETLTKAAAKSARRTGKS